MATEKTEGKKISTIAGSESKSGGPRPRSDRSDRRDRDDDDGGRRPKKLGGGFGRRKVCRFCTDQDFILDYKNVRAISGYLTEHGKIVPRRISGTCARHQRKLTTALKRAQNLALLGYTSVGL